MAFNPQQPRVPAGQPGGGQWAGHGSEAAFREHFAKQMRGEYGITEGQIKRRLDVMVKEHLETVATRADYHATRKPGPTLPQTKDVFSTHQLNPNPPAFVTDFSRRFPSLGERRDYLRTSPTEKLTTALKLLGDRQDLSSSTMRKLLNEELGSRLAARPPKKG